MSWNADLFFFTVGGELDEADGGIVVVYQGLQTLPCTVGNVHGISKEQQFKIGEIKGGVSLCVTR